MRFLDMVLVCFVLLCLKDTERVIYKELRFSLLTALKAGRPGLEGHN